MPEYECEIKYTAYRNSEQTAQSAREAEDFVKERKTAGGAPRVSLIGDRDGVRVTCRPKH